jgi:hypothetical protein
MDLVLYEAPSTIPLRAQSEMRQVLDLMSVGSLLTFIKQIEAGHVDGSYYGGNFNTVSDVADPADFSGCFLGWAGFLEQRSIIDLGTELDWPRYRGGGLGPGSALENFVALIHPGQTPNYDPDSAALYLFVSKYLEDRLAPEEEAQNGNV